MRTISGEEARARIESQLAQADELPPLIRRSGKADA